MRDKFIHSLLAFVLIWTMGEVFESSHKENLVFSLCMMLAYMIYCGLFNQVFELIKYGKRVG